MKFWDTSAIIPLLIEEKLSKQVDEWFSADTSLVVWWGTSIECVSAISRLERESKLPVREAEEIIMRLSQLRHTWREIQPGAVVKQTAERILRVHPLRPQDAQQLAACLIANRDQTLEFITLDERLEAAAQKEGLRVLTAQC
ncbi:MAG: hypothetical protein DCC75_05050 [Proteobacteria bacterium]|nr:MAG: hypothetical protein DCC75_05050 [Pseudomonadota bacterium]